MGLGPLQLIPQIRQSYPAVHHLIGRIYLPTVCISSIMGLFIVWTRGSVGDLTMHIAISVDAALILVFSYFTITNAIARDIKSHRRWAMRLFIVSSAVWFYRISLMLWLTINQGPVGFDPKTFTGPFLTILGFAQFLLPLFVLELYFRAQTSNNNAIKLTMAFTLFILTIAMAVGSTAAALGMWLPRI